MRKTLIALFLALLTALPCLAEPALFLFGGEDHKVFLGCLNADQYNEKSIWNEYGPYGSKFSGTSIWNQFGQYGGQYSQYSPFNEFATHPPVIVDAQGNFYGYLTANQFNAKRTRIDWLSRLVEVGKGR